MGLTLDRRITIQQVSESQDSMGTPVESWSTYATRFAKKMMATSDTGEGFDADSRIDYTAYDWLILRDATTKNVTAKMRIVYDGDVYEIDSVQEYTKERRNGYLIIHSFQKGTVDA